MMTSDELLRADAQYRREAERGRQRKDATNAVAEELRAARPEVLRLIRKELDSLAEGEGFEPDLICMAGVQPRPMDWLWKPWIPRGELTMLDGDPSMGKSTLTLDLIARVSRGWPMPPAPIGRAVSPPGDVVILSAEDDPAATIRPRLDAAGADCGRVFFFPKVKKGDDWRLPILPDDLELLAEFLAGRRPALVTVDPLTAFVHQQYDAHKDSDIRHCLHRTIEAARSLGAALLVVRHLNKFNAGAALYRGGGSIGIIAAARSGLVVGRDPDDEDVRVLSSLKNNLAAAPLSLTYRLVQAPFDVSKVEWLGETDHLPDEILTHPSSGSRGRPADRKNQAESFIRQELAGGPVPSERLSAKAKEVGIRERALWAAKRTLKVRSENLSDRWYCSLPPDDEWHDEIPE
jgi:hypothetical protein